MYTVDFQRFLSSLTYMWQGMLCIFIVIGVLVLSVMLLSKLTAKKSDKSE